MLKKFQHDKDIREGLNPCYEGWLDKPFVRLL